MIKSESPLGIAKVARPDSPQVLELAERYGTIPTYVIVQPERKALLHGCYENVQAAFEEGRGTPQYGFAVYNQSDLYMTAEHHAVLRRQDGMLVDITPDLERRRSILLVPTGDTFEDVLAGCEHRYGLLWPLVDDERVHKAVSIMKKHPKWACYSRQWDTVMALLRAALRSRAKRERRKRERQRRRK